jgi:hypothetical protein
MVSAPKSSNGSVVSQFWYFGGKSMLPKIQKQYIEHLLVWSQENAHTWWSSLIRSVGTSKDYCLNQKQIIITLFILRWRVEHYTNSFKIKLVQKVWGLGFTAEYVTTWEHDQWLK